MLFERDLMWSHACGVQGNLSIGAGEDCPWCGAVEPCPTSDAIRSASPAPSAVDRGVDEAEAEFEAWFIENYPGPDTIIYNPKWHAPKIFHAATHRFRGALASRSNGGEGLRTPTTGKTDYMMQPDGSVWALSEVRLDGPEGLREARNSNTTKRMRDDLLRWSKGSDVPEDTQPLRDAVYALLSDYDDMKAAIDTLLAERDQLIAELTAERAYRRWNIEEQGGDLFICRGDHDKSEKCEPERYVRASRADAAERARLTAALAEAEAVVTEANNSLYGSHGYFLSLNGGPPDKYHLSNGIENLKKQTRDYYVAREAAERRCEEIAGALRPFAKAARGIPDNLPDELWTECHSHPFDEKLLRHPLPEEASRPSLTLWLDGHPLGDFRRAADAIQKGRFEPLPPPSATSGDPSTER